MRARILGPLRVETTRGSQLPAGGRPRDVLAALLLRRGRPVPADVLLDLVWSEQAATLDVAAVHTVVARLRRQFGAELIDREHGGYLVPDAVRTDVDEVLLRRSQARACTAQRDWSGRRQADRAALSLWAGPVALEGVRDDLVVVERARLADLRRGILDDLATSLLDDPEADPDEAHDLALELMTGDPLDEAAAVLGMRSAQRLGRQAEALSIYSRIRRDLREELGIDPGRTLTELHQRVLAQAPPRGAPGALSAERPVARDVVLHPARVLPAPRTPTVGRLADLDAALGALSSGHRLVTVTGPAGVGKSRLLAEIGAALRPSEPDIYHVALEPHAQLSSDALALVVGSMSGLPMDGADPVHQLAEALANEQAVILVDEAEWALAGVAEIARALLDRCPGIRLVLTSRTPLGILGERLVVLDSLPVPAPGAAREEVCDSAAVQLLASRLADRGTERAADLEAWVDRDLQTLAEVARRLDGLPLALELAAGRSPGGNLDRLLDVVATPLDLVADELDREPRHQSLREAIGWSIERLTSKERRALARLSVFVATFARGAAVAVIASPEAEAELRALVRGNLVQAAHAGGQGLRLLTAVRDAAREVLLDLGEVADSRRRHREWYAARWRGAQLGDTLIEDVGRTQEDHLAALENALTVGDTGSAVDLGLALFRRWQFSESVATATPWMDQLSRMPGLTDAQAARLAIARTAISHVRQWEDVDVPLMVHALRDDPDWAVNLFTAEAIAAYTAGDTPRSMEMATLGLDAARASAPHHLPESLALAAVMAGIAGEAAAATEYVEEARARIGPHPSAVHLVTVVPKLALAMMDAGRPDVALDLLQRAADGAQSRFGIQPTTTTVINLGWAALGAGRPRQSFTWFVRGLHRETPWSPGFAEASAGLGCAGVALAWEHASTVLLASDRLLGTSATQLAGSLAAHVERARSQVTWPPDTPLATLPVDVVAHRVLQLAAEYAAVLAPEPEQASA